MATVVKPPAPVLILTKQQEEALALIEAFFNPDNPKRLFILDGAAGTGKTTLIGILYQTLRQMRLCAYTGKAANNLNLRLGIRIATTLHKLLYKLMREEYDPVSKKVQPVYSKLPINLYGQKVGLDEYSLINKKHGQTLMDTYAKVLAVGDSFQLKPVDGKSWIGPEDYDYQLTEITRQAQDSGIIRQLHHIRYSKSGIIQADNGVQIIEKLTHDIMMMVDVILCYTNPQRHKFNRIIRKLKGYPLDTVVAGESIIALQNNETLGLYNGSTYEVGKNFDINSVGKSLWLKDEDDVIRIPSAVFVPDNCDIYAFTPEERKKYNIFDFGYCQTVHKSQGSEWGNVAVFDDYKSSNPNIILPDWRSWHYTGVSRAKTGVWFRRLSK